jgi:hypothetical protein
MVGGEIEPFLWGLILKTIGGTGVKKERSNSGQPNYDGRAYEGALFYSCNLEPNALLDGGRQRVQLLRRVQLLGLVRHVVHACWKFAQSCEA